jgi:hypothetical protein
MLHVFVKEFNNKCDIRKTQAFTVLPSNGIVPMVGGSLRVLRLLPPLKLVAMI